MEGKNCNCRYYEQKPLLVSSIDHKKILLDVIDRQYEITYLNKRMI